MDIRMQVREIVLSVLMEFTGEPFNADTCKKIDDQLSESLLSSDLYTDNFSEHHPLTKPLYTGANFELDTNTMGISVKIGAFQFNYELKELWGVV